MKIDGKNIIVTGASSGFGKVLVDRLMEYSDTRVLAVARHIEQIPTYDRRVIPFSCDVSDPKEVDRLFDFAFEKLGIIDIFIANAGFGYYEKLQQADWQHITDIFNVNVISPIYALQKMGEQNCNRRKAFVMVASAAALVALPGFSLYSSTKFALNGFADAYKYEQDNNMKLTVVYPVAARTNFFKRSATDAPMPYPTQSVDAVVNSVIKGIKIGRRKMYPSKIFRYGYPILRAFPFTINLFLHRQYKNFCNWMAIQTKR